MILFSDTDNQAGITLVELIVSIVVIAIAASGVFLAVQFATRHSADPMIRQQAVAIADAYMEEIMLRRYTEPEEGVSETGQSEGSESRSTYDDVYDYNNTINEQAPTDQTGNPMPGLENYEVTVVVDNSSTFGPGGLGQAANVTVTVTHDSADVEFSLNAFKTKY